MLRYDPQIRRGNRVTSMYQNWRTILPDCLRLSSKKPHELITPAGFVRTLQFVFQKIA